MAAAAARRSSSPRFSGIRWLPRAISSWS